MADNQTQKEIVLCKMFTGNYWEDENNLGYETINMFLPDKSTGESYIYLPACGDYEFSKHADLPYILEINTSPGMTDTSDLPAQSASMGISYDKLVELILMSAGLNK